MQEIKDELRLINDRLSSIDKSTAVNTSQLGAHMARTEINERRLEKLEYVLIGIAAVGVLGGVIKLLIS